MPRKLHNIDTLLLDLQLKAKLDNKAAEVAQANVDLAEKVRQLISSWA